MQTTLEHLLQVFENIRQSKHCFSLSLIDACTALQSLYTCITDVNEAFVTKRNTVGLIL
jgi:hypothetical protein